MNFRAEVRLEDREQRHARRANARRRAQAASACAALALCGAQALAASFSAFGPETYVRHGGPPLAVVRSFSVLNASTAYLLRIRNGGGDERRRVPDATIRLNGNRVLSPNEISRHVGFIEKPVVLRSSNTLSVELGGNPGELIVLEIAGRDDDPPTIVVAATPQPNANGWNRGDVTVSFTCSDRTSGIATCPAPTVVKTEGPGQVVTGRAQDRAGNRATATISVSIDKTPPTIVAAADPPANAQGWNRTNVNVQFQCADTLSGIAACAPPAAVTTESAGQAVSGSATDRAGNSATATTTVRLDKTAPTVAIVFPTDGATVSSPSLNLTGSASDALAGVESVSCNDVAASLTGADFGCALTLATGSNAIAASARDRAGNTGSANIRVTLASGDAPPTLSISTPQAQSLVFQKRPSIAVAYGDDLGLNTASLAFTANGHTLPVRCDAARAAATCVPGGDLPEGPVLLVATIEDSSGQAATARVEFSVDAVPVDVTITSPETGLITRDGELEVSGSVGPAVASVQVDRIDAALANGTFRATVPLRQGVNMLVAVGTQGNGKTGTASVQVTRDFVAPVVRIDGPYDGFVSSAAALTVSGFVSDAVNAGREASVRVNGVEAQVTSGSFMAVDVPLARGPNRVEAVATDAVGNVGRHAITVTFQTSVGAHLLLESGDRQAAPVKQLLALPLTVALRDDLGNPVAGRVVRFTVARNSGTLSVDASASPARVLEIPTDGNGRAALRFTLGEAAGDGNNRVTATALGAAGAVEFTASGLAASPARILMGAGDNQRGAIGQPLATPLEALVLDDDGNPIGGAAVTFAVDHGGGTLDGTSELTRTTGTDGIARAVFTLGPEPGINNNVVTAAFEGLAGLPASFTASGLVPGNPAETRFSGVVLDNVHAPIPGARVTILGTNLNTSTDDQGRFLLANVPVGHVHLRIDPAESPRPETFPPLEFETVTVAGQKNVLGQPILIPALDTEGSRIVGGAADVTLTMKGVPGLTLTVFANSVTCRDGARQCRVSISQVQLDKVPMAPPGGTTFTPAWTVQPAGTHFDPPARVTMPNMGLAPGRTIDIFQFDHDINQFISVGKGTVAEDGALIVSDPGFGITAAGWGGGRRPPEDPTCASGCDDGESCTFDVCEKGVCQHPPLADGATCDDSNSCTEADRCGGGGTCKGDSIDVRITQSPVAICVGENKYATASVTPAGRELAWTSTVPSRLTLISGNSFADLRGITRGVSTIYCKDAATECSSDVRLVTVYDNTEFNGVNEKQACVDAGLRTPNNGFNFGYAKACVFAKIRSEQIKSWVSETFANSAASCGKEPGPPREGTPADAVQHARWSCELTNWERTQEFAEEFMRRHENNPRDTCRAHEQDFNNNERGKANAAAGRDCAAAALEDLAAGLLQVNNDPRPGGVQCP